MSKKQLKIAFIGNIVIALLVLVSVVWMMSGVRLTKGPALFSGVMLQALKYYTVDSNILMGIAAAWMAVIQGQILKGKRREVPLYCQILKLVSTAGVTLTMLVTAFFLAPTSAYWLALFMESNFLMHLLTPLLSILIFVIPEQSSSLKFRYTPWGISTTVVYACIYSVNVLTHLENGQVVRQNDWYGFFMFGPKSVYIVIPVVLAIMYGISAALWAMNKKKRN